MGELTEAEVREWKKRIDLMDRYAMCRLWRFGGSGHPCLTLGEVGEYFEKRLTKLGGFSPEISKQLGWD